MYLKLIRNKANGSAITGRLVIDGRWFCNTLERVGYQIPALCYHVAVTHSPKFKRLLPLVCGVPQTRSSGVTSEPSEPSEPLNSKASEPRSPLRSGIRFHRGTKPEHSTGCILVVADNNPSPLHPTQAGSPTKFVTLWGALTPYTLHTPQGRSAADVEQSLTQLLLNTQDHEEIILDVTDFRPGTEYGYNTPCPSS